MARSWRSHKPWREYPLRFALKPANIMPEKQRRADMSANNNLGHAFVMFGLAVFWPCVLGNIAGIIISRIKIED